MRRPSGRFGLGVREAWQWSIETFTIYLFKDYRCKKDLDAAGALGPVPDGELVRRVVERGPAGLAVGFCR